MKKLCSILLLFRIVIGQWNGPDLLPDSLGLTEIGSSYVHVSTENGTIRGLVVQDPATGLSVDRFMNIQS